MSRMQENLLGVVKSESESSQVRVFNRMLKSPVMISSEGKGTKNSRRFWNSSKKVDILEDGGR